MELYVPITYPGRADVAGVAALYLNVDQLYADIVFAKRIIWSTTFLELGILFLALLGIVRRASRTIVRRSEELGLLLHASQTICSSLDLDRVLEELARENVEHVKVTCCRYFWLKSKI